ncbi:MAG: tetraether lipid synthase Tes [archaeon]
MTKIIRGRLYPEDHLVETDAGKVSVSKNVDIDDSEVKEKVSNLTNQPEEKAFRVITSLCPECVEAEKFGDMRVPAVLYVEDSQVKMKKECEEHGETQSVYWEDAEKYFKASKEADWKGKRLKNPDIDIDEESISCPLNCGICKKHKSHTNLGNIAVTNRCPLNCFYCFFFAKEGEPIYEPSQAQIRDMAKRMKQEEPVGCNAMQITGGEPLVRDDIVEVVEIFKEEGYDHIQMNTEGINIAEDPRIAKKLRMAGANVYYLSFDGTNPQVNPKNYWEAPKAIENIREAGSAIVLVPTVIGGHNDDQLGNIINFASSNLDVIRGINFQPVSLVGRMPKNQREEQRITIPGAIDKIEEQTNGQITKDDFYPIPFVTKISDLIEQLTGEDKYRLSPHFACGAATYVYIDQENEKLVPITRFIDVQGLLDYMKKISEEIETSKLKKLAKTKAGIKLLLNMKKFIDEDKQPKGLNLMKSLRKAITANNYDSLKEFHHKSLFIGFMHFQDPYNYDVDRVERCVIHYGIPDGRVVPFCAFNVLPELYRDKAQREFGMPPEEWEKRTGKKLQDDNYIRDIPEEEKKKVNEYYKKHLENPFKALRERNSGSNE